MWQSHLRDVREGWIALGVVHTPINLNESKPLQVAS